MSRDTRFIVVMPSIRELPLDYIHPILDAGVPVCVVDDTRGKAPRHDHKLITYWSRKDIEKYMPKGTAELIPEHNPSCKDFGLYYAYQEGFDVAILLDDDVQVGEDFLDQVPVGGAVQAHPFEHPTGWLNTMQILGCSDDWQRGVWARGVPYDARMLRCNIQYHKSCSVTPMLNEGLWWKNWDVNGMDKLMGVDATRRAEPMSYMPSEGYVYLRAGQHLPLSIMNCQIHTSLVPGFYQPSDWHFPGNYKIRRHDDVFSMYVLKALMDIKRHIVTAGRPIANHMKVSDGLSEAKQEHITHLLQPDLFRVIDAAALFVHPSEFYADMAEELAEGMLKVKGLAPKGYYWIIEDYARKIALWARLFQ